MPYLGDYAEDYPTLNFKFTTRTATGVPATLTAGVVKVYKGSATDTEINTGVTLTADFDTVTGLNNVLIDLSFAAFYAVGQDYSVVITTGTVGGVSVVGEVVATFSIENRFAETILANGAHGGAAATITLSTPIAATVPDTQKVDVNTIKTSAAAVIASDVWVQGTRVLTAGTNLPTAATIASDVWVQSSRTLTASTNLNIPTSDHNAVATWAAGTKILTAGTNLNIPAATTIASDVWVQAARTLTASTNLNIPTSDATAKAVLKTSVSDTQDAAAPHSLTAIVLGALESSVAGTVWTIRKTTGTAFTTKTVTSDSTAKPIVGVT